MKEYQSVVQSCQLTALSRSELVELCVNLDTLGIWELSKAVDVFQKKIQLLVTLEDIKKAFITDALFEPFFRQME